MLIKLGMDKGRIRSGCIISLTIAIFFLGQASSECPASVHRDVKGFRPDCKYRCNCANNEQCDEETGECPSGCLRGWMGPGCQYRNYATMSHGNVRQHPTSESDEHDAYNAIDGNVSTCSMTGFTGRENQTTQQLWRAEFMEKMYIVGLIVTTQDTYIGTFGSFSVEIGNLTDNTHLCYKHKNMKGEKIINIPCVKPIIGNVLKITVDENIQSTLVLCEVEIFGGRLISFHKPTSAESTLSYVGTWNSSYAVDGRPITKGENQDIKNERTCAATIQHKNVLKLWWNVKLETNYYIQGINFFGRLDRKDQYENYTVNVASNKQQDFETIFTDGSSGVASSYNRQSINYTIPIPGDNVRVERQAKILVICEFEIFGECPPGQCGWDCSNTCVCSSQTTGIDKLQGTCPYGCNGRWTGQQGKCDIQCSSTQWGPFCNMACGKCNGSFECNISDGTCPNSCEPGWKPPLCVDECDNGTYGSNCSQMCGNCVEAETCDHINGNCSSGCAGGYTGILCTEECDSGTFGPNCSKKCGHCVAAGICNHITGYCLNGCEAGYIGNLCIEKCDNGTYGSNCSKQCGHCVEADICDHINGYCVNGCEAGYKGNLCVEECDNGTYGSNCSEKCGNCADGSICNHINGYCLNGCEAGFNGNLCIEECDNGTYGSNCSQICGHCVEADICDHETGYCFNGCEAGYNGSLCIEECDNGTYGSNCSEKCGHCAGGDSCNHINGYCLNGCEPGYNGNICIEECDNGTFGSNCSKKCGHCVAGDTCDRVTGYCLNGCEAGYNGSLCIEECDNGTYGSNCSEKCGHCVEAGICNHINGYCLNGCEAGYKGNFCVEECVNGTHGSNCSEKCGHCAGEDTCNHINGYCLNGCEPGYNGNICIEECDNGTFGSNCSKKCGHCVAAGICNHITGYCLNGCEAGYNGSLCIEECTGRTYGLNCTNQCGYCINDEVCNPIGGNCEHGCQAGWKSVLCKEPCDKGTYGSNCKEKCGHCIADDTCDQVTGYCLNGCKAGYNGSICIEVCGSGSYGENCSDICGSCLELHDCDTVTGYCKQGCKAGFKGNLCKEVDVTDSDTPIASIVGPLTGIVIAAALIVTALFVYRRKFRIKPAKNVNSDTDTFSSGLGKPASKSEDVSSSQGILTRANYLTHFNTQYSETSIPVSQLRTVCKNAKFDRTDLFGQFESLPYGPQYDGSVAKEAKNVSKNRYKDMYPYNKNRVVLPEVEGVFGTTYINASYINGYNMPKKYIAAQGALAVTVDDIWRMVWSEEISVIVMLTRCHEQGRLKCFQYWSEEGPCNHGNIRTELVSVEEYSDFKIRTFTCSETNSENARAVVQFHYTAWPDKDVPDTALSLVQFWRTIRRHENTNKYPWMVHCSAGVGRTGTFIALDYLYEQGQAEGSADIKTAVFNLREQRLNMVQTKEQYVYLHETVAEILDPIGSVCTTKDFREECLEKLTESKLGTKALYDEYKKLCQATEKATKSEEDIVYSNITTESYVDEKLFENLQKCRNPDTYPADIHRPRLGMEVKGRNDFINAVFVSTFRQKDRMILTQVPLEDTVIDFLRMIWEYDLSTIVLLEETVQEEYRYWTAPGKTKTIGPFVAEVILEQAENVYTYRKCRITLSGQNKQKEVRQYHFSKWPNNDETPLITESALQLISDIENTPKTASEHPIVIQCNDGAKKSGLFCVLFSVLERMKSDREVAIAETTRLVRLRRSQAIDNLEQYNFCYKVIKNYLEDYDVYANVM